MVIIDRPRNRRPRAKTDLLMNLELHLLCSFSQLFIYSISSCLNITDTISYAVSKMVTRVLWTGMGNGGLTSSHARLAHLSFPRCFSSSSSYSSLFCSPQSSTFALALMLAWALTLASEAEYELALLLAEIALLLATLAADTADLLAIENELERDDDTLE